MTDNRTSQRNPDSGLTIVEIMVSIFILVLISLALIPLFIQSTQQSARTTQLATATQLVAARLSAIRAVGNDCSAIAALQGTHIVSGGAVPMTVLTTGDACPGVADTVLVTVTVTGVGKVLLASAATRVFVSETKPCTFSHASSPAASVDLGNAFGYSVLASTAVTNGGASVYPGLIGTSAGAITGMAAATTACSVEANTAGTAQAQSDLVAAYNSIANRASTGSAAGDLAGATIYPGVYRASAAMAMTTALIFDAQGDPNAVFIFQIPAALNTTASSMMTLANGAQSSNIFWQVAGAVTLGASSHFIGTILGNAAITIGANTSVDGRALTGGGAVTLDNNIFSTPGTISQ